MPVNTVNLAQPTNIKQPNNKSKTSNKIKNAIDINKNGSIKEEVMVGLAALGAIALAGISIAKGKNTKAGEIAPKKPIEPPVAEAVSPKATPTFNFNRQEIINSRMSSNIDKAIDELNSADYNSDSVSSAKKLLKRNLPKQKKKEATKILDPMIEQNRKSRQMMINAQHRTNKQAQNSINMATQASHNITSKTEEGLISQIEVTQAAANQAKAASNRANAINKEVKTHKTKKTASRLRQNTESMEAKAKMTEARNSIKLNNLQAKDEAKLQHKLEYMQGQTDASKETIIAHREQTQINAAKRKAKQQTNKVGYQREYTRYKNATKEQLLGVLNSPKSSNVQKQVAGDLLANI